MSDLNIDLIKKICKADDLELKESLINYFQKRKGFKKVIEKNNYILVEGNLPLCLIAHIDTVFTYLPSDFYFDPEQKVLWCPQGAGFDDRAGIYAIITIIENIFKNDMLPSIVLTCGEEIGGIGARELIEDFPVAPFKCNAIIELDRANKKDSVFYYCDNKKFEKFINKYGFETAIGTFTDISIIAPQWGIAAVNLSIGYVNEHFETEHLHTDWCRQTINKVSIIIEDAYHGKLPFFKYVPLKETYHVYPKLSASNLNSFCLLCGRQIDTTKGEEYFRITDPAYSYNVCKACYDTYY